MHNPLAYYRRVLKNVFWPPAFIGEIGAVFEIIEILMYYCDFKIGPATTFSQNPIFEMASMVSLYFGMFLKKIKVILSKIIYVLLLGLRLNF